MSTKNNIYLSLGSNIRPREYFLSEAIQLLQRTVGLLISKSTIYETESWGFSSEVPFLNIVILMESAWNAESVLRETRKIEKRLGRTHKGKPYRSRKIDIDILYINKEVIDSPELTVPHPHLTERRFVLEPLAELSPDFIHPILQKTSLELLKECRDASGVKKIKSHSSHAV